MEEQTAMKRFYKDVSVDGSDAQWGVLLDGRPIRTAGGRAQIAPTRALAQALAEEWAGQPEEIEPGRFALGDLADYAIDVAGPDRASVIAEMLPFAQTDTLCYRADPDEPLYRRQREVWEPALTAAETRLGVRFERVSGVIHRAQPPETLARLRALLDGEDAFVLAALRMLTSLAASLVIALEACRPGADAEALWAIADLEADWQAELWGRDWEAQDRRATRLTAFSEAMRFAELAKSV